MPTLAVRDLTVDFGPVRALDGVSLEFLPGEVHGLIGENGAGKSTLMRVLAGIQPATRGEVLVEGAPTVLASPHEARGRGIAMVHQEIDLIDDLGVAENIYLGREPHRLGVIDRGAMNAGARAALQKVGLSVDPSRLVGRLSLAERQLVEIAKACGMGASTIILDEPTAVLTDHEAEALFALIGELRASGAGVIFVSHRLAEVELLCDRVSVLRDGRLVCTEPRGALAQADMARAMVGRDLGDLFPPKAPSDGTELLRATGLGAGDIAIRAGEVVGLAGLIGAGRTELAEEIAGLRPRSGRVEVEGAEVPAGSLRVAIESGIAYLSEDRKDAGLVLPFGVRENVTLATLRRFGRIVPRVAAEAAAAKRWVDDLQIRIADIEAPVSQLSGGNQQKVALAKWLEARPKVLILDEPTRGVDVGAKREIYFLIAKLAAEGAACLVISSELTEIVGLCHRALVMREGRIVGQCEGERLHEESLMLLAAHVEGAA